MTRQAVGRPTALRVSWTVGDQVLSSASNFLLAFIAARSLSVRELGAFGVAFTVYVLVLGVSRSFATDPLVVRFSARPDHAPISEPLGAAVLVGLIAGVATLAGSLLAPPALRAALATVSVLLPFLLLQDASRFIWITRGQPVRAVVSDGLWLGLELPLLLLVRDGTSSVLLAAWGVAALVTAIVCCAVFRAFPRSSGVLVWVREQGDISTRFLGEFVTQTGVTQSVTFVVAAIGGLTASGVLRAGQVLTSPLTLVFLAAAMTAVPEGVRVFEHDPERLRRLAVLLSVLLASVSALVGAVCVVVPRSLGAAALGHSWDDARSVVVPLSAAMAASGAAAGAWLILRVRVAVRESLRARLAAAPGFVVAAALGTHVGGARGAAWALVAATVLASSLAWRACGRLFEAEPARRREFTRERDFVATVSFEHERLAGAQSAPKSVFASGLVASTRESTRER